MKTAFFYVLIYATMIALFAASCTIASEEIIDNRKTNISDIVRVVLKPNHDRLVADGYAQINLTPLVYIKTNKGEQPLPKERVKEEWLEYISETGERLTRLFSTSDKSLIGKTINVNVKIKGTDIVSNTASFKIEEKRASEPQEAIFPVIFHIIQTENELEQYAAAYDKQLFYNILNKLNNAFGGKLSRNPVGIDTHIRFRVAEYSPLGERLNEPGINRVKVGSVPTGDDANNPDKKAYDKLIKENNLVWNPIHYLNIWLISDVQNSANAFASTHSVRSIPRFAYPNAEPIAGLNLEQYTNENAFSTAESGVLYKLQLINERVRPYSIYYGYFQGNNELIHYVGTYFGLLPNNNKSSPGEDYCDDTIPYTAGTNEFYRNNMTPYKETKNCFFLSENIMDDPTGVHTSISQDQSQRIWQILKTCPERSSWKSVFAFEGK